MHVIALFIHIHVYLVCISFRHVWGGAYFVLQQFVALTDTPEGEGGWEYTPCNTTK